MKTSLLFSAVLLAAVLSGCGTRVCDAKTCSTGCCDSAGQCQSGNTALLCGTSGATCGTCSLGQSCALGMCTTGTGGGTGSGGGGSGGGSSGGGAGGGLTGGGGGGGGATGTYAQFCRSYLTAVWDQYAHCGLMTAAAAATYAAQATAQCDTPVPAVLQGRIVFDAAGAQSCLESLRNPGCVEEVSCQPERYIHGTVGAGGTCFSSYECTDAYSCDTSLTCPGRCTARVPVGQTPAEGRECVKSAVLSAGTCRAFLAAGQFCGDGSAPCAGANECTAQQVCGPIVRGVAGAACSASARCELGLNCVAGACAPMGRLNAACDNLRQCQVGLRCSSTNVCIDASPRALGSACSAEDVCVSTGFCNQGVCALRRGPNASCTWPNAECAAGLVCSGGPSNPNGVCQPPGTLNQPCAYGASGVCAQDLYCTANFVCANRKQAGASCAEFDECLGSCESGVCSRAFCYER